MYRGTSQPAGKRAAVVDGGGDGRVDPWMDGITCQPHLSLFVSQLEEVAPVHTGGAVEGHHYGLLHAAVWCNGRLLLSLVNYEL